MARRVMGLGGTLVIQMGGVALVVVLCFGSSIVGATEPTTRPATQDLQRLQQRAEKGDAKAQFDLGLRYVKGEGVEKDRQQAVAWFGKAAEQGLADAQFMVGAAYERGVSVAKDPQQAVMWYRKAAEQGHADAQLNLGVMYANGEGVEQDVAQAYLWLNLAVANGCREAPAILQDLEAHMSPAQIEKAKGMCREFEKARLAGELSTTRP